MRKIFLKNYNDDGYRVGGYRLVENSQTMNYDLQNLWSSFYSENEWIRTDMDEGMVSIWNSWDLKDKKWINFISTEEEMKYDFVYDTYWFKRWDDMPRLEMTEQNYEEVLQNWKDICNHTTKYLIISIDNLGWVSMIGKDALSQQDLRDIEIEHQKYLEFRKKCDAYKPFRGKKNREWQSQADEEYFSDFLTDEEIVWKKKKL